MSDDLTYYLVERFGVLDKISRAMSELRK